MKTKEKSGYGEIENLIFKYLSGSASDDDVHVLHEWMRASRENVRYVAELSAVWSAWRTAASGDLPLKANVMLARLNSRIDADASAGAAAAQKRKRRILWISSMSAAAAVVILSVLLFRDIFRPVEEKQYLTYVNDTENISAVMLNDSSKVWLQSGARMDCAVGGKGCREVMLVGNAYFDVVRDTLRPFIVKTKDVAINVLGTAFSVEAPVGSTRTSVVLERGSVRLQSLSGVNLVRLTPDQKAVYDSATDDISVELINSTSYVVHNYNKIEMAGVTLHDIISHINEMYGVVISAGVQTDSTVRYDINYKRTDSLDQVLDIIKVLTGVECKILQK